MFVKLLSLLATVPLLLPPGVCLCHADCVQRLGWPDPSDVEPTDHHDNHLPGCPSDGQPVVAMAAAKLPAPLTAQPALPDAPPVVDAAPQTASTPPAYAPGPSDPPIYLIVRALRI
jgi:hypothetical protein